MGDSELLILICNTLQWQKSLCDFIVGAEEELQTDALSCRLSR